METNSIPLRAERTPSRRAELLIVAAVAPSWLTTAALGISGGGIWLSIASATAAVCATVAGVLVWRHERRLRSLAMRDSMTGLHNHQYFLEQLARAASLCDRQQTQACVMMIDVDRFKEINDSYGHQAGDEILRQVGDRLLDAVREYDTVARYGGEEFGIVLPQIDEEGAVAVAERLRMAVARSTFELRGGAKVNPTVSVGYAIYPVDAADVEELVDRADRALYTCKYYGRNQLRRCSGTDVSAVGVREHRELVEALAAIVELRDGHTGVHAREVSLWARKVAEALDLEPHEVNQIEAAGLVHDIGKVGVPDGILLKPERLTAGEWEIIREHPGWGAGIVGRVSSLKDIARLVEQHQEWFNGGGYPHRLKHDEIEIGARIISIVDAFHAIIRDRPYREARTVDQALTELERMAGEQFDPKLVVAFRELVLRGEIDPAEPAPLGAFTIPPVWDASEEDDAQAA